MTRKSTVLMVLGLLIVAGAASWAVLGRRAPAVPVRTVAVSRAEKLVSCVAASGTFHLASARKSAAATTPTQAMAALVIAASDITRLKQGQPARISFDPLPDVPAQAGRIRKIGQMALPETGANGRDFAVEVTVDDPPPQAREGMSCQAEFILAEKENVLALPISALTPRQGAVDEKGNYVTPPRPAKSGSAGNTPQADSRRSKPGQKEFQGVFVKGADSLAHFRVVKTGLMGDMQVEVLDGLQEGEEVITGPLASLRQLEEWTPVRLETEADRAAAKAEARIRAEEKKSESRRDGRK